MFELIICYAEKHEWQQIIVTGGMTHQYIVGVQVRRCVIAISRGNKKQNRTSGKL